MAIRRRPLDQSACKIHGSRSPFVSGGMHLVNGAPQGRRSSVEGGSTYVVVGKTW